MKYPFFGPAQVLTIGVSIFVGFAVLGVLCAAMALASHVF